MFGSFTFIQMVILFSVWVGAREHYRSLYLQMEVGIFCFKSHQTSSMSPCLFSFIYSLPMYFANALKFINKWILSLPDFSFRCIILIFLNYKKSVLAASVKVGSLLKTRGGIYIMFFILISIHQVPSQCATSWEFKILTHALCILFPVKGVA